ncbi:MAG TPA: diaminopimelate decarboxylase [Polyangiaceae bacterium]|jgi:diaminopimelate decarboxylase|nr:diaminopimelate decarboxylase [Polyangiaceae bacterium]
MFGFSRNAQGKAVLAGAELGSLVDAAGVGTPAYVYDLDAIENEACDMVAALGDARHVVAYAVKANSAASIIRTIVRAGCGVEVVSRGELEVALGAGVPPGRIMTTAVAKADDEIDAAIGAGIRAIQMESIEEIDRVGARARTAGKRTRLSLRINPGVSIDTHAHVATGHDGAKFGISLAELGSAWDRIDREPMLEVVGVSAHVGSTLKQVESYLASARVVCGAARARLASGKALEFVDFGGGFGIDYGKGPVPRPAEFLAAARRLLAEEGLDDLCLFVEPGRSMVAPHGVLVARLVQEKRSRAANWAFIDAAMNDLIRPALYGAVHRIEPLDRAPAAPSWRVAGAVCESADDFGEHPLGDPLPERVVIRDAGAYGFVMASEYNGRPLPAEIFASGGIVRSVSESPGRDAWVRRRLSA